MKTLLSVWLVPQEKDKLYLYEIIDKLAKENNAPTFIPHLTLLPGIEMEVNDLKIILNEVFNQTKSFKINKTKISQSEQFFKTVFIEFELDENLKNLFMRLSEKTDNKSIDAFNPHISLLYKTMPEEEKEKIIKNLSIKNDFIIDKVIINAPGLGQTDYLDIPSWRNLYEIKLND